MKDIPRLIHHFEPEKGWMNDPNGLCYFQGKYHAFFQHYPFETKWGPMHWGHAVSEDLVSWQELPIALHPDMPYEDDGGCFSGSALEKDGKLYLMYTSVSKAQGQTQSIAISEDGVHFEKWKGNPVISQCPLDPENKDFRDPKIFSFQNEYRMVCGAAQEGLGVVLLYRSEDLFHWEYLGKIFESDKFGKVPECPDLFPLGEHWVLMFSRMDTQSAQFIVGDFDGKTFTPISFQQPELGPDFYAPQSFLDPMGRRVVIGWLFSWLRKVPEGAQRAGALAVPKKLSFRGDKIICAPVEEVKHLLTKEDACVRKNENTLQITDGKKILWERPLSSITDVEILPDTRTREVFLNGGEENFSFYLEINPVL